MVWGETPDPVAPPGHVVVRVLSVALTWSDVLQARGQYAGPVPDPPFIPGHEFCGVVQAPAPGEQEATAPQLAPGSRVCGFLPGPGALAELITVHPSWLRVAPDALSDAEAAAVTTPFLTADAALITVGRMEPGDSILIHAAAGGVGRVAVQLARLYGAGKVLATAGSESRRAEAAALGADATSDYDAFPDMAAAHVPAGMDVILDSVGGKVFDDSLRLVRPLGRLVTIGASSGEAPRGPKLPTLWQRSVQVGGLHIARWLSEEPQLLKASLQRFDAVVGEEKIHIPIASVRPPSEIREAMNQVMDRRTSGRVVINLATD